MRNSRPRIGRTGLRSALLALFLLVGVDATPVRADDLPTPEAKYRAALKRPSLNKRMQGRIAFARAGLPEAVGILAADYLRPEDPKDYVRYLIATVATEYLANVPGVAPGFAAWRAQAHEPIDAWLWFRSLVLDRLLSGTAAIETARAASTPAVLRAAAIRALASMADAETVEIVGDLLQALPANEPDRSLLIEASAAAARTWGSGLKDDATRAQIERVARLLDDQTLSRDTQDIVARNLASLFGTDVMTGGSAPWLRELAAAVERPPGLEPPETQYAPGPFFGLRAVGRRIVYVIDASDSMLSPLSPDELKKLKPTTSSDDGPPKKGLPKADPEEPLPWQKIKCRFDAAREVLKRSLRALKPDQSVCVVLFGDDARTLPATPGLRLADPKTIESAVAQLDRVQPTPAPGDKLRPYGKLRGETNLHGGLRLAFRVTTQGLLGPGEYVDLSKTGCDTIFLLSDGNPTTDDFRKVDKRDGEKTVKDRETMAPAPDTPESTFQGPYGDRMFLDLDYLTDDVRRMNLFRQAEIHCVAIGEVDDSLLQGLASIGGGRFRRVGEAAPSADGK